MLGDLSQDRQPADVDPMFHTSVLLQGFPQYLQQYDVGFRSSNPSLGRPSFISTAQTAAGPQQPGFASQVRV